MLAGFWFMMHILVAGFSCKGVSVFFFILFISLYELVCIELKFQALDLVHFKLVATLLVGLAVHCAVHFG
jgi:hypothetical protein